MALYRNVSLSFWTDSRVTDDFTPEDRYMYLYLITNPHTNLCGCYEVSIRQIANETGYNMDTIERLLVRFNVIHKVAKYCHETKELLLLNWAKYNWTKSDKLDKPILDQLKSIKCDQFRQYVSNLYNSRDTVSTPYQYCIDTRARTDTDTDTVTVSDTVEEHMDNVVRLSAEAMKDINDLFGDEAKPKEKEQRKKTGQYGWVRLTSAEYARLVEDLGQTELDRCIKYVDESAQSTGNKNKWKDWNLVLRKCSRDGWGLTAEDKKRVQIAQERSGKSTKPGGIDPFKAAEEALHGGQ